MSLPAPEVPRHAPFLPDPPYIFGGTTTGVAVGETVGTGVAVEEAGSEYEVAPYAPPSPPCWEDVGAGAESAGLAKTSRSTGISKNAGRSKKRTFLTRNMGNSF